MVIPRILEENKSSKSITNDNDKKGNNTNRLKLKIQTNQQYRQNWQIGAGRSTGLPESVDRTKNRSAWGSRSFDRTLSSVDRALLPALPNRGRKCPFYRSVGRPRGSVGRTCCQHSLSLIQKSCKLDHIALARATALRVYAYRLPGPIYSSMHHQKHGQTSKLGFLTN